MPPLRNCDSLPTLPLSNKWVSRLETISSHILGGPMPEPTIGRSECRALEKERKIVSVSDAVERIRDRSSIVVSGFVGCSSPEYLLQAVRQRFQRHNSPSGLHLIATLDRASFHKEDFLQVATTGDRKSKGLNQLAVEGLLDSFTFGWTGNCPELVRLIAENKIQAWNLPLGAVSLMIRDAAARRPGPISKIGLGTFVDPRESGGKLNQRTNTDVVKMLKLDGEEYLWYKAPTINVALLRGTTADVDGNITFEKEAFFGDALNMAIAAHSNNGLVIVQVERVVERGTLHPRLVHIPAALVTQVVVSPPEFHSQSISSLRHDPSLTGEIKRPLADLIMEPLPLSARKIIAHRCMLAFNRANSIVNLGVGMPEGVGQIASRYAALHNPGALPLYLSTEVGVVGGFPAAGDLFGAACNPDAVMPTSTMIDLIQGGSLDAAVLGCAEVDSAGNVNVSKFSGRHPGCGGFIDISQSAKQVIFAGTFMSGGLKVEIEDGKLIIVQEGRSSKFRKRVQEKTFAGVSSQKRRILYVTERAVFKLLETEEGPKLQLTEIAPGVRLKEDILEKMEFEPVVREVCLMDKRCFLL